MIDDAYQAEALVIRLGRREASALISLYTRLDHSLDSNLDPKGKRDSELATVWFARSLYPTYEGGT